MLSGALGAFFSALIRLYSFDNLPEVLLANPPVRIGNWHLFLYSLVPPLIGMIAAAVLYLASPEAGYVTGATLHVNGGMAML